MFCCLGFTYEIIVIHWFCWFPVVIKLWSQFTLECKFWCHFKHFITIFLRFKEGFVVEVLLGKQYFQYLIIVTSAFSKTWLSPELRQVLSCESPAVFLHFPLEEKGPQGPFYQPRRVLAKGNTCFKSYRKH